MINIEPTDHKMPLNYVDLCIKNEGAGVVRSTTEIGWFCVAKTTLYHPFNGVPSAFHERSKQNPHASRLQTMDAFPWRFLEVAFFVNIFHRGNTQKSYKIRLSLRCLLGSKYTPSYIPIKISLTPWYVYIALVVVYYVSSCMLIPSCLPPSSC